MALVAARTAERRFLAVPNTGGPQPESIILHATTPDASSAFCLQSTRLSDTALHSRVPKTGPVDPPYTPLMCDSTRVSLLSALFEADRALSPPLCSHRSGPSRCRSSASFLRAALLHWVALLHVKRHVGHFGLLLSSSLVVHTGLVHLMPVFSPPDNLGLWMSIDFCHLLHGRSSITLPLSCFCGSSTSSSTHSSCFT